MCISAYVTQDLEFFKEVEKKFTMSHSWVELKDYSKW
jgi:hypothetical protein